ncbi:maltose/maltodextrin ABC transporter substrate-binding protein MalE, partial [Klebsiella pneumoniae]|nr:maltose/maltodextrin ABC transporter substrate-binding protein MalE [Klebsiella pneumoniae]
NGLAEVGTKFEQDTGMKVSVEPPDKLAETVPQVAATGAGPDLSVRAHDRGGGAAPAGRLAARPPARAGPAPVAPGT